MVLLKDMVVCPHCGSREIVGPLESVAQAPMALYSVETLRSVLPDGKTATYRSYICEDCGYVGFFVDDKGLENVREYLQSRSAT